jgi:UDP-N-acetylmuramoyl-tripeptide--D-alanyl-D-alanine ligase
MKKIWNSEDLSNALEIQTLVEGNSIRISSEAVEKGDIFITMPSSDGHNRAFQYISHSFERGASGCITKRCENTANHPQEKMIYVEDITQSLNKLAAYKRQKSNAVFLALTGTCGKTTVKNMIYQLVSPSKETFAGYGNFNNSLGVKLCLASMQQDAECAIFELGMSAQNEIFDLTAMVKHHIALITNVGIAHLENFNSVDEIASAKAEIFENMHNEGIAVLPQHCKYLPYLTKQALRNKLQIYKYGFLEDCDAQILSMVEDESGTKLKIKIFGQVFDLKAPIHGEHQARNVLASLLCAKLLGADVEKSLYAAERIQLPKQRGQKLHLKIVELNVVVIDKSYNANPVSVRGTLAETAQITNRKVLILGDMLCLGDNSINLHIDLKQSIVDAKISKIITIGEYSEYLHNILPSEMTLFHSPTVDIAAPKIIEHLKDKDVVVVQGSMRMHMKKIVQYLESFSSTS